MKKFHSCLVKNSKPAFKKNISLSTSQPPNIRRLLITAKFERLPISKQIKQIGFFPCGNCYHKNGYFKECLSFSFKSKIKLLNLHYKPFFSFHIKDIICRRVSSNCDSIYFGQTEKLKQRTQKHISDLIHSSNSNCKKRAEHLRLP